MLELTHFWLNVRGEWLTFSFFEIQWRFTYFSLILWNETHLHSVRVLKIEEEKRSNTIVIIRMYVKFMQITFASHFTSVFFSQLCILFCFLLIKFECNFSPKSLFFRWKYLILLYIMSESQFDMSLNSCVVVSYTRLICCKFQFQR